MARPMQFGNMFLIVVILGALAPQVVGMPGAVRRLTGFVWHFGWPCTFIVCDGIQRGPLPGELPSDATHTDWVTRMVVPVWWGPHMYPPRTPPLLFATGRPMMFYSSSVAINAAYVVMVIFGATYLAGQMQPRTLLRRVMLTVTAALTMLCVAYYVHVIMCADRYPFFAYYQPVFIASNALGIFSAVIAGCIAVGTFVQRHRRRQ